MTSGREIDWGTHPLHHPAVIDHEVTCPSVPVQLEGHLTSGVGFYFRYRSGLAALGFGATTDAAIEDCWTNEISYGHRHGGSLTAAELNDLFDQLYRQHCTIHHRHPQETP